MNKKILFTGLFVFIFSLSCLSTYAEDALSQSQAASGQQPAQTPSVQQAAKLEVVQKPIQPSSESYIIIKNKSPQEMFDDANYLYQLGEYDNARILFNKVVNQAQDPVLKRKAELAREVIDTLLKSERVDIKKAPEEVKDADRLNKRQKQVQLKYLYDEAASFFDKGDYVKATKLYKDILAIAPEEKEARSYVQLKIPAKIKEQKIRLLYREALQNYFVGNYDLAKPALKEILALNLLEGLARRYLEVEIPNRIKEQKTLIKEQKIAGLLRDAKVALYNNKDYDKATSLYKEVLLLDPRQEEARSYLEVRIPREMNNQKIAKFYEDIKVKFDNKEYQQAAELCKQLLALEPKEVKANDYLKYLIPQKLKEQEIFDLYAEAKASFDNKDYPKALQLYKDILALDPNQKQAERYVNEEIPAIFKEQKVAGMLVEAKVLFEKKDYEKSSQLCKDILAIDPGQKEAKDLLKKKIPAVFNVQKIAALYKDATQYFSLGDYERASQAYKDILAIDPAQTEAKEYLQVKIPELQKEAKLSVLYGEARGYFNSANYERSRQTFSQILNTYPDEAEAKEYLEKRIPSAINEKKLSPLYTQAFSAFNNQNYAKAEQLFKEIISIDPNQLQAKEYLDKRIPQELNNQKIASLYKEAHAAFGKKDYVKATKLFEEIIALDPKQEEAKTYLEKEIPAANLAVKQAEQERLAALEAQQKAEKERLAQAQAALETKQKAEKERLAQAALEAQQKAEKERLAQQQLISIREKERLAQAEFERQEREKAKPEVVYPAAQEVKEAAALSKPGLPKSPANYPKEGALGYLYELAFRYYDEGEFTTAKEYFIKILVVSPREETAQRYLLALLKYQRATR